MLILSYLIYSTVVGELDSISALCGRVSTFAFLLYRLVITGKIDESTLVVQGCSGSLTTQPPPSRRRSIFGVFPAVSPLAIHADLVLRELEFFFGTVEFFSSTADPLSSQLNPIRWGDLVFHFRGHRIGRDRKLSLDDSAARRRDIYGYDFQIISFARGRDIQRRSFHDLEACRRSIRGDNPHGLEDRFCSVPKGQLAEWRILHVFLFADGEGSCTLRRHGFPEPLQDQVNIKNQQPLILVETHLPSLKLTG